MMKFSGRGVVCFIPFLISCIVYVYLLYQTPIWKGIYRPTNISGQVRFYSTLHWLESRGANYTLDLPKRLSNFQIILSLEDQRKLRQLFFKVIDVFKQNNISYHLRYGSLIGAYRHYGIIPWDDDLDVYVNKKHVETIKKLFSNTTSNTMMDNFELRSRAVTYYQSKIWIKYVWINDTYRERHDGWPFVDVYYYIPNGSVINYLAFRELSRHNGYLPTNKIFPLQMWPFEGTFQPVPRDIQYVLKDLNRENVLEHCFMSYRHSKHLKGMASQMVKCSVLYPYFPFADYSQNGHLIKVGNKSLPLGLQK